MEHLFIWQAILNVYEQLITAPFFFFFLKHTMVELAAMYNALSMPQKTNQN